MIFLFLVVFFLFFVHFIFYRIFSSFIDDSSWLARVILGFTFFLLSISPFLSALLSYRFGGWFPKLIYDFSVTWLGFAVNLLVSIIASWIVIFLLEFLNVNFKALYVFVFFFITCLAYSGYGLWQAKDVVVSKVDLASLNFPQQWKEKKVVQISDIHLGNMNGVDFANRIFGRVAAMKPDIVFITGDLLDGVGSSQLDSILEPIRQIKPKDGIYFVFGNHEEYFMRGSGRINKEILVDKLRKNGVQVLDNSYLEIDGVQLIGISYPGLSDVDQFLKANIGFSSSKPSILLFHTPSDLVAESPEDFGKTRSGAYFSPNLNFANTKKLGIKLQLSGHTHQGQFFPFNFVAKWFYKNYYYGLNKFEDILIYTSSGVGTWGPPFRTMTRSEIVEFEF